jgi:hypothetical protein
MRRDMDLYRQIVLKLEALDLEFGSVVTIDVSDGDLNIEGYTHEEIAYHLDQVIRSGMIDDAGASSFDGPGFRCLTPTGHDFADSVRDDKLWALTKEGALKAGGFTLQLLADLAKGFTRKQIEKHTGIQI